VNAEAAGTDESLPRHFYDNATVGRLSHAA
jgi:hypothetical protein